MFGGLQEALMQECSTMLTVCVLIVCLERDLKMSEYQMSEQQSNV